MKIVVLYGENGTGKSSFLNILKESGKIILPKITTQNINKGKNHALSLVLELKNSEQDLGFEDFDSFMTEASIKYFLKEVVEKKNKTQTVYLETRTDLTIGLIGRLVEKGFFTTEDVYCLYFEPWQIPIKKTYDKEGFIIHENTD